MTTSTKRTVLITGATRGLGAEASRRLAALGFTVWLGARTPDAGEEVAGKIRADHPDTDVRVLALDVTSDDSVRAAHETVAGRGHRARRTRQERRHRGHPGGTRRHRARGLPPGVRRQPPRPGPGDARVLADAAGVRDPRLVMVSSGMGSFGVTTDPARIESTLHGLVYPSSKAALNMVTTMYAKALPDVRVVAVDPGYTATALNGFSGIQTVTEGTHAIIEACTADTLVGWFVDRAGVVPWQARPGGSGPVGVSH